MDISLHQDPCKRTKLKTDDTENACALSCLRTGELQEVWRQTSSCSKPNVKAFLFWRKWGQELPE